MGVNLNVLIKNEYLFKNSKIFKIWGKKTTIGGVMALTKPFINTIPAFDATQSTEITLNILGGDAIGAYGGKLYTNSGIQIATFTPIPVTNDIADTTIRTYPLEISAALNIVENNKSYIIEPITYAVGDTQYANGMVGQGANFTCYKTPSVKLYYYGIVDGVAGYYDFKNDVTLGTSTPSVKIEFNPNDLNSPAEPNIAKIYVYGVKNGTRDIVFTSDDIYNFSHDITTDLYSVETELDGFALNVDDAGVLIQSRLYDSYEIEWVVRTIENFTPTLSGTTTGINCYYKTLINSPLLTINNLCSQGVIEINSKLTSREGTSNPQPPQYIDNEEIDLTGDGWWVQWANYFNLQQPYTFRLWGRDFNVGEIATLSATSVQDEKIVIKYNKEDVFDEITSSTLNYTFISLESGSDRYSYYIESNRILSSTINSTTKLFINVQEQNELFDIKFQILN